MLVVYSRMFVGSQCEKKRKAGGQQGNVYFMRAQDEMTLVPFHQEDDGEAGQYFGGTPEVLIPEWDCAS